MSYPSFEEYTDALRMPPSAVFQDPLLAGGSVRRNSAGVPFARSGNFALTYEVTVNGSRYAVACLRSGSDPLGRRYEAISRKLTSIASPWFMDFDFQPAGIRTESGEFPIVRMRWAEGCSLAQFLSGHRDEPRTLMQLRETLRELARHLQAHDIAHGDIQPGNVSVRSATDLKLIDYDGRFVPELEPWGGTELGQRNFQHPGRSWLHYDERLDRVSFARLDVALAALATQPALWEATGSDESGRVAPRRGGGRNGAPRLGLRRPGGIDRLRRPRRARRAFRAGAPARGGVSIAVRAPARPGRFSRPPPP